MFAPATPQADDVACDRIQAPQSSTFWDARGGFQAASKNAGSKAVVAA
jgi:hypothetical protein